MTKPFDPFNQCTEYYYRIEKLLADNTALKAENESLRKDMLAAEQLNNKLLREALEFLNARIVTMDLGGVVERALSHPASTEALDKYVAEKVKEATATQNGYYEEVFQDGSKQIAKAFRQRDLAVEAIRHCIAAMGSVTDVKKAMDWPQLHNAQMLSLQALDAIKESDGK